MEHERRLGAESQDKPTRRSRLFARGGLAPWVVSLALISTAALAKPPANKGEKKPAPSGQKATDKPAGKPAPAGKDAGGKAGGKDAASTAKAPVPPPPPVRWTAAQPDAMADLALARARALGPDALAGLLVLAALDERASLGKVRASLRAIGAGTGAVADDARWLAGLLTPSQPGPFWTGSRFISYDVLPESSGLVRSFAILGPFQDKGDGIREKEGPEAPGQTFTDTKARYSWGAYDVSWRRILPSTSTARGVPLDLYVSPRSETCTYLASKVTLPVVGKGPRAALVHVASTGKVRLLWDGADVAMSEDVHRTLVVDRLAARIEVTPGPHLVALKVCSGSTSDEGRVRVRFTDEDRKPIVLTSSSDLLGLQLSQPSDKGDKGETKGKGKAPSTTVPAEIKPPKGIKRVLTSLEQALVMGKEPTPEEALRSAVARTLGGADDARSPRAPGLFEVVLRSKEGKEPTPDMYAFAGWISPFGAERTERLNLALVKGKQANDEAAVFAQRRLFESSIGARFPDWALARAREEPLASATDAEARLLKLIGRSQMGAQGAFRAQRDELLGLANEARGHGPLVAWVELAGLVRADPQTALTVYKKLASERADARDSRYVAAFRALGGADMERAAAESVAQQRSIDEVINIGHLLLDAGRNAWAREVFFLATELCPNKASAFEGLALARKAVLADELGAGQPPSESPDLVTAALARAQVLEPTDVARKAEIALRTSQPKDRAVMADEQAIVAPSVFLARAKANPAKKGEVFDRQLHWTRVVTYHADRRVSQLLHYAREIVVEPRTEMDLYESDIPSELDRSELLLARVHRKDGSIALPEEQGSGGRSVYVRWPKLKTGDVVEIAVRNWTRDPVGRRGDAPFYFIDYVGSTDTRPVLYNEVIVDSPAQSPLAVDVLNGKAEKTETKTVGDRHVVKFVWENPSNVRDEPLAPPLSETVPLVVGSTWGGWADFRAWYRSAVEGFSTPDERIKELAAELTKGKKTRDEKIRAIFEYVADTIRYVNYVSGEAWLPNRPQISLSRKQGDCDDKAMLLITLLRAIGIQANEVLVQTRYTGQNGLLRSEKVAIPLFDHGIAYLPAKDGAPAMWLDATSPQSRLGPLPGMDARTLAFFIDEGPAKMVETPASSPDDHGIDAEWKVELSADGQAKLVATERHTGDAAFEARTNLVEPDARKQWVEQYLTSKWVSGVQLDGEIGFDGALALGAAKLTFQATSDGITRREGKDLVLAVGDTSTFTSTLAPLPTRTLPVVLPAYLAPRHDARTITIVPPPGYGFAELPPSGEESGGEFGRAKLEMLPGEGGTVVVKRTMVFDLSTIPVAKYPQWRSWLQRVDGLMNRLVRLVPSESASTENPVAKKK